MRNPKHPVGLVAAIVVLVLAALATVVGHSFSLGLYADRRADPTRINTAGRQRMFSQRLAKEALLLAQARTPEERVSAERAAAATAGELRRVQQGLRDGDAELRLPGGLSPEALAIWSRLDADLAALEGGLRALQVLPTGEGWRGPASAAVQEILKATDDYWVEAELLVRQFERESLERLRNDATLDVVLLIAPFLLLLAALFMYRGLTLRLGRTNLRLEQRDEELQRETLAHRRSEQDRLLLAAAVEQAAESIVITDPLGIVQYVNPAFERNTGFSRAEIEGRTQRMLQSGQQGEEFYRSFWSEISVGRNWRGRIVNRRKDGQLVNEVMSVTPVLDEAGRIRNYISIKQDRSREIELEQRLRQAQKLEAIGALAGGIAHDFNNILTSILGYVELAQGEIAPGSPAFQDLGRVRLAALRAKDLIQQILAFSRKEETQRVPLRLEHVVTEVLDMLRFTLPKQVRVRTELTPDTPPVLGDPAQMDTVLMNLCINAGQAMPQGGELTIRLGPATPGEGAGDSGAEAPRPLVRLEVSDTGIGMDEATLGRIFEPFFTTRGAGQGTGLGLASAYGIVQQHDGHIAVASRVGQGTTVTVYLPAQAEASLDS